MTTTATTATTAATSTSVATTPISIPAGANPRGTVIVLAGRGEAAPVYTRFGTRIASDAYTVRIVTGAATAPAEASDAVRGLLADDELPSPKFLVGSDAGGALALQIAAARHEDRGPAGVVVAGLPEPGAAGARAGSGRGDGTTDVAADAEVRSACPVHQSVLAAPGSIAPGALTDPLPADLELPAPQSIGVPVLAFFGEADSVIDRDASERWLSEVPHAEIRRTAAGLHDALNDRTHRSVAARIVLFLEDAKNGGEPLLR
ncbi:alpha/beta hydrolase [Brevibacterium jeotgali]|uniref:Lysophospholipase, alpha-beta hydrolase superfamily n=1 Tax=Brevibacterium jeotgali TaxID=1262550 RepID=A0A2H1L3I0_9MICO|nr:hypothetical protein [Brevibacterium jeotgali]TWC01701.1 alpha-beta hydrolase superfamily lysophospholipase [Brevibacterium jeotgali]SMY11446.1 Lysophospholipase, alpha-beta hydrolase superfamily [Brevibacterium jeotgali]